MKSTFLIKYTGSVPRAMAKQGRGILKAAWHDLGVTWHRELRPKHFTAAGAREYKYQPREGEPGKPGRTRGRSYLRRKQRMFGHTLPLVFTGELRSLTRIRDVRATAKGVRVVMQANKANWRRSPGAPNMAAELRTISSAENRKLQRQLNDTVNRGFAAIRSSETVRITS